MTTSKSYQEVTGERLTINQDNLDLAALITAAKLGDVPSIQALDALRDEQQFGQAVDWRTVWGFPNNASPTVNSLLNQLGVSNGFALGLINGTDTLGLLG